MSHNLTTGFKSAVLSILSVACFGTASLARADTLSTCYNYLNAQDYQRAVTEAKTALKRKGIQREDERDLLLCLGAAHRATGRVSDALAPALRAEVLSSSTQELAVSYFLLGSIYLGLDDIDKSELYTQRSLRAYRELRDTTMESMALNNLAAIVQKKGDLEQAIKLYQESISLAPENPATLAKKINIASIHVELEELEEAERLFREVYDESHRSGDGHKAALARLNLGEVLRRQGLLDEAEMELTSSLSALKLIGDRALEAIAYGNLGMLESDRMNKPAAEVWFAKAEKSYRSIGNQRHADVIRQKIATLKAS